MTATRKVEIFSAGCQTCLQAIAMVEDLACSSCEVVVLDMHKDDVAQRAKALGVSRVPAVAIDGVLAECCTRGGLDEATLRAAGLGEPLS